MASKAQRKATKMHRRRAAARGLVRIEVQAVKKDAVLIRALAAVLREGTKDAEGLRMRLANELSPHRLKTAFDVFGSDLPDEVFAGVFEQPRRERWREIKL
jgi:hypothetical protein